MGTPFRQANSERLPAIVLCVDYRRTMGSSKTKDLLLHSTLVKRFPLHFLRFFPYSLVTATVQLPIKFGRVGSGKQSRRLAWT
jgi:hypothetical protein